MDELGLDEVARDGSRMRALLFLLALATALPLLQPMPAAAGPATLLRLEQSIRAAIAHTQSLREDLHRTPLVNRNAEIAGIADGGPRSSLAALRLTARSIDRRLETLRLALPAQSPEHLEILLVLRQELAKLAWAIEEIPQAFDDPLAAPDARDAALRQVEEVLAELDGARAALAALE